MTGVVFSYMQGIIHPYYMVALAPAIGALVGVGAIALLQSGMTVVGRAVASAGVLVTGVWAYELLDRTPGWLPWLRWTVLLAGVLGAVSVFAVPELLRRSDLTQGAAHSGRRRVPALVYAPLALALVAGLGGPLAYSLDTANSTHTGSIPSAGPAVAGSFGGGGGAPGGAGGGRRRLRCPDGRRNGRQYRNAGRRRRHAWRDQWRAHRHRNWYRDRRRADRNRRIPGRHQLHRRHRIDEGLRRHRIAGPGYPGAGPQAASRWAASPAAPRSAAR